MQKLFNLFYEKLPVRRSVRADEHLHLLNEAESRHIRRSRRLCIVVAALLSVLGFLAFYLPVYFYPQFFPSFDLTLPFFAASVKVSWAELVWGVLLTVIELMLVVLVNIAGVHEIAVATGFINAENKAEKSATLLGIGLERKNTEVARYGIDPFQGLNKSALFVFNLVLRLKGWLASQAIRFGLRLLLGRYAVRSVLDFSGLPLYMALNAYSVHVVLREAQVSIIGQVIIKNLCDALPRWTMTVEEKNLLYDTLQYIAVSKRDFHQNHYLLTRELLDIFQVPSENPHYLPDDYLERLKRAPERIKTVCQIIILLGFMLDARLSTRERRKIKQLNQLGVLPETYRDIKGYLRDFISGRGVSAWSETYLKRARGRREKQ